ncbi:crossover junction endodeoxyribonuclease RuvC [Candidatus Dojkabacteria bacterium CG_4_10_14_3_um_filter_Dojkabacteria_WS6_41_9]|uniref:Crossover junction endodeoxyribonuclease RuvC n=1 Tax=Candidatus Dojkabacteria bacterium CG_4_10_14_0_2_um_filter_Dojkabacteria_WS6_41_15 TaxID=2014249 RepID=A0A2M7W2Q7_9BACT|nr:MAG: crossover junction endodeoxyribonuclease RuvC [Candidatus Dojkabacteria bacterium CG_4_10_14_3_um_filter_Dojkabacteria_WS6_41_9]PJA15181.1 MAG: crossover junction endodeoxyribonuclease RuvC [Candidatus Dojkabacteria bacterium CG_4_10_14_0_2_um_filter_Dojkabacteria_WS6_41_15]
MTILGLDPGIDRLGWAVLKDTDEGLALVHYGLITTDKTKDSTFRLGEIAIDLQQLILTHTPDIVFIEKLFFSINAKTAMLIAEVRGAIKVTTALQNVEIRELHPMQLKKKILGSGKGTKKEIQGAMKSLFNIESKFKTDDVADAIAIAYIGMLEALGQI